MEHRIGGLYRTDRATLLQGDDLHKIRRPFPVHHSNDIPLPSAHHMGQVGILFPFDADAANCDGAGGSVEVLKPVRRLGTFRRVKMGCGSQG
jgi:hypothetical protein